MMDLNKPMRWIIGFIGAVIPLSPLTVFAQNKAVDIPLFDDDAKPLKNIFAAAKANGMFTDPVNAVNSITEASANKPYLMSIGPEVYHTASTLIWIKNAAN